LAIGSEEVLLGGVEPQFRVDVSATYANYRSGTATSSITEVVGALQAAAAYVSAVRPIAIVAGILGLLTLIVEPRLLLLVVPGAAGCLAWAIVRSTRRRRVAILYRFEGRAAQLYESLANGVGWLADSRAVWRVTHEERGRGNIASIVRTRATVTRGEPANLLTNISIPSIAAAGQTLLFLPDALLIRDRTSSCAVPYANIRIELETTRFSENEAVPSDSQRFGTTWLYANKDGSPDRRRANNHQIPVVEYARLTFSWRGSGCVLLVSHVAGARHFVSAIQQQAPPSRPAPEPVPLPKPSMPVPEVPMPLPPPATTELERVLQASLDQKRREDLARQFVTTVRPEPSRPAASRAAMQTKGEWIGEDGTATVHGFATGGLVWVGNTLRALNGYAVEPSLIDPALPVDAVAANTSGSGLDYWPSYRSISAASRRAFLQWLAGGRNDRNIAIGYVFIFFYGLERRIYEFIQGRGSSADEALAIGREVACLFALYGAASSSFRMYAGSFLDLIATIEPRARDLAPDASSRDFGPSHRLKLLLGELALAGKPIPAELALEWIRSSWSLNTPATRCASEFELLFHIRYARQFGEGMVIKPNKTYVDLTYRPASGALDSLAITQRRIPDVTQLTRPFDKLVALVTECTNALDAFSRFLGKTPEGRGSLAAIGLLPEDLVEATPSSDASALASLVRSRLDGEGQANLAAGELLQYVRLAKPEKVSKNESMLLAQALEKLGYGIEPDVRLGGPVYDAEGRVIVFRRLPDCPSTASGEYATATLCLRLGAVVSAADDEVSEAERALLQKHIAETLRLSAGERQRLAAHLAWLLEEKPGTNGLKKQLAALTRDARHHIGQLLITVATTDGRVDPREMKMLEKLYDLIGLQTRDLYADIHATLATDDEPLAVSEPATAPKGYRLPPKPVPAAKAKAAGIDMDRVRLKIAETREVSTLLSSIFAEEEAPAAVSPPMVEANTIGTLDAAHSELLRRLAERERWPRDEVERLAAELALLPDGALETINDYAYAIADEPLWEDDDPVAINSRVAMELIA